MIRSLETGIQRWLIRLRLCFIAPLLALLIAAPVLAVETIPEELEPPEDEEEKTPCKDDTSKGFFASIFPDACHVHRVKAAERWGYQETLWKFFEELHEEDAEKGEPNPYSAFENRPYIMWSPKRKRN